MGQLKFKYLRRDTAFTEIQAMATSKNSPRRRHNYLTHVILVLSHDLCTEMQIVQTNHWCAASSGTYRIRKLKFVSAVSKKLFLLIATSFSYFIASVPIENEESNRRITRNRITVDFYSI